MRRFGAESGVPGFTANRSLYRSDRSYPGFGRGREADRAVCTPQLHLPEYDPRFRLVFEAESRRIQAALGARVVAVEHVGSSAVPGLRGRREIDILVGVRSGGDVEECARLLAGLGYVVTSRPVTASEGWCLLGRAGPIPFELLIVEHESALWRRHVALREYLRRDAAKAAAYERLKSEWAERYGPDTEGYKQAKRRFWASVVLE
jgi:GrpB-like predicted nucleotidyltransferase (UPF0157 family)